MEKTIEMEQENENLLREIATMAESYAKMNEKLIQAQIEAKSLQTNNEELTRRLTVQSKTEEWESESN